MEWCELLWVARQLSLLEAVLLSFVKQVNLRAAQVHNLRASISLQGDTRRGSEQCGSNQHKTKDTRQSHKPVVKTKPPICYVTLKDLPNDTCIVH